MPPTLEPMTLALGTGILIGAAWPWIVAGGSVLAIPAIIAVVGLRHPRSAQGTSIVAMSAIALLGTVTRVRQRSIDWVGTLEFTIPALAGLELERVLGYGLLLRVRLIVLGCLLLLTVSFMLSLPKSRDSCQSGDAKARVPRIPLGFVVGILGGWLGLGGGLLVLPSLLLSGLPLMAAAGSSFVSITSLGIANAIPYAASNTIQWKILGTFLLGVLLGTGLSGIVVRKIGHPPTLSRMVMYGLALLSLLIIGVNVHGLYT